MPAITADTVVLPPIPSPAPAAVDRSVVSVTTAPSGLEGEGFPVRRMFAGVDLATLDPFVHMDQMGRLRPGGPKGTPCTAGAAQAWLDSRRSRPRRREGSVHASIIDMTLRLPVDEVLFDELRTDFLPKAAQHPGFCGFQYVLAEHGRAIGILWYEQPEDLIAITQLVGTWFQDHIAPRLAGPQTAVRSRVVLNVTPPRTTRT